MPGDAPAQRLASLAFVLALAACAPFATSVDYEVGWDSSSYRAFGWVTEEPIVQAGENEALPTSALARQRVRDAIARVLVAKGFRQDDPPDFTIAYSLGYRDRISVDDWGPPAPVLWPYGPYPRFGGFSYGRTTVRTVRQGTLSVDIFDAVTRRPVWHGRATEWQGDIEESPERIAEVVQAVLAAFPGPATR